MRYHTETFFLWLSAYVDWLHARVVDSNRQSTDLQRDALIAVGVDSRHLFEDRASGANSDRTGLTQALEFVRPGDVLVVWKLDRLGRSLSHLIEIVNTLKQTKSPFAR